MQILTEPESVKKKLEKDRICAPFEFYRSQVAPFDVLPYVKPNHWSRITLEMKANEEDYEGFLQTDPVMLLGMPPHRTSPKWSASSARSWKSACTPPSTSRCGDSPTRKKSGPALPPCRVGCSSGATTSMPSSRRCPAGPPFVTWLPP